MTKEKPAKTEAPGPAEKKEEVSESIQIPEKLPILMLRDIVVFPYMIVPLYVGRPKSKQAVDHALNSDRMILLLTQRQAEVEDPTSDELYLTGTAALIVRMLKLPDTRMRVLVQGIARIRVKMIKDNGKMLIADVSVMEDQEPDSPTIRDQALIRNVREKFEQMSKLGKQIPNEILVITENIEEAGKLADIIASNLDLKIPESQKILGEPNSFVRLMTVYEYLTYELEMLNIQNQITMKAQGEMDKNQREYFLRQQLKAIQKELGEEGENAEEIGSYLIRLESAKLPENARKEAQKSIERLQKMHPESAESAVLRNYLDWMLDLPWNRSTRDSLNLNKAARILNQDHYGLEKVKERILEYLSVRKLTSRTHGPILCFVGPPGVGKTSLGKSIARALNKKFVRISLGGVRDEAEIRGHRRTYVGALPGKIIQEIRRTDANNPVFMMDEVDKIGADFRGDPSSALLEVLDPEQNNAFIDHYLGVPFDLSKVMFITTANMLEPIQPAFRDRMEIIHLHGYTEEEKLEIARRHLIPRQIKENGLTSELIRFTPGAISNLIRFYTREAGVRNLERNLGSICRKIAYLVSLKQRKLYKITARNLEKYAGAPKLFKDQLLEEDSVGVATGMAWTPYGGDLLFIEVKLIPGKGKLILTGSLGDVMKESASAALSFLKASAGALKIDPLSFDKHDIHIHVPEGGIPKDGPSAGIALTTALCSAFLKLPVQRQISITGEITLRGKVLPVGGIKEKVLAARRAGIQTILMPEKNRKDLGEMKPHELKGIQFHFIRRIEDAVNLALGQKVF